MTTRHPLVILLVTLAAAASLLPARAATIGYWRFENSSDLGLDSSGNSRSLTNSGAASYTLPASGRGSHFFDPIPQTDASNSAAASLINSEADYLSTADPFTSGSQDFTIESLVNVNSVDSVSATRVIAAQASTSSNAAWQLVVTGASSSLGARNLVLQLNTTGSSGSFISLDSDFQFTLGSDYYIAAAVDFTLTGVSVTFYFQNLTAGTALQTVTRTNALTSIYNTTAPFTVGRGVAGDGTARYFDGIIDEVRLSDTALTSSQLLATVPEPRSIALLTLSSAALLLILRRHRHTPALS